MNDNTTGGSESDIGELRSKIEQNDELTTNRTFSKRFVRIFKQDKLALIGGAFIIMFIFAGVFAPFIAPYDPGTSYDRFSEPMSVSETDDGSVTHLLGTNDYGQDMLSRIIFGARISLLVAFGTLAFSFTVGTAIGLAAGYYGGWIDNLLMRYIDFQWAFPTLILALGIIAYMGSLGVTNVIVAIGIAYIDDFARLVRGEVLSIREKEYVTAAQAVGMKDTKIMISEILPNAVAPLIVQATLMIPLAILAEASLSFLGLGVSPGEPSWGMQLSEGQPFIRNAWWITILPGIAIMFTVLSFNVVGDALRDTFDISESEVSKE